MSGYVTDTLYPGHVHREISPAWLHCVATALGQSAADPAQPFRWCELGCGDGLNAALLAAACPHGRFVAIDANAEHIARGRELAHAAGLDNLRFVHADFESLASGPAIDHEGVDYLVSHGVWSWVATTTRDAMLALVDRWLTRGGLFYLGYMSHPGASPMATLQQLLYRRAAALAGDSCTRAADALTWLRQLTGAGLGCMAEHPGLSRQLEAMATEPPSQIAHEFLARHWQPQHSGDVIERLVDIDCSFIGSATPLENIDAISLPGDAQPLVAAIDDVALRESAKDAARNQSLRRDLYQRGGHHLSPDEHRAALDRLCFSALPGAPTSGGLTLDTRIGPVPAPADLFDPVLRALATGPKTFAELAQLPAYANRVGTLNIVVQTLLWAGCLHPRSGARTTSACTRLNTLLRARDDARTPIAWQAIPALGCALAGSG